MTEPQQDLPPAKGTFDSSDESEWTDVESSEHETDSEGHAGKKQKQGQGAEEDEEEAVKVQQKKPDGRWMDVPDWKGKEGRVPIASCPAEILDMILASPLLSIIDHISLAASCKFLRTCYLSPSSSASYPLWSALVDLRPANFCHNRDFELIWRKEKVMTSEEIRKGEEVIGKIWSGRRVGVRDLVVMVEISEGKDGKEEEEKEKMGERKWKVLRSMEWDEAIEYVNEHRICKKDALEIYQITYGQLFTIAWKPHDNDRLSMLKMFRESAVRSVAMAWHGGEWGHQRIVKDKAEERSQELKDRRKRNKKLAAARRDLNEKDVNPWDEVELFFLDLMEDEIPGAMEDMYDLEATRLEGMAIDIIMPMCLKDLAQDKAHDLAVVKVEDEAHRRMMEARDDWAPAMGDLL